MAEKIGKVHSWTSERGQTQHVIDVSVYNERTGKIDRKRIFKGPDEDGDVVGFKNQMHAGMVLGNIRSLYLNHPESGTTDPATKARILLKILARYLPGKLEESLVKHRWADFLKSKEEQQRVTGKGSDDRLYDLSRMVPRGYLDFFETVSVDDVTGPMLKKWLGWMCKRWPDHKPKTRHHIVNDFMTFERWLVNEENLVTRMQAVVRPDLPAIDREKKPKPSVALVERYLDAIPEYLRGLFLTRSIQALRVTEARRMRVRNYDWETRILAITRKDTKTAKGVRDFEVDDELGDWLDKWVPKSERLNKNRPLFINPRAMTPQAVASKKRGAQKRGLPEPVIDGQWTSNAEDAVHLAAMTAIGAVDPNGKPLFPPNLMGRHAALTHAMERTRQVTGRYDVKAVQDLAGHEDAKTTALYTNQTFVDTGSTRRLPKRPQRDRAEG